MKAQKFLSSANIILGILLALTPFIFFPVCEELKPDGNHMKCFYSGIFITSMGIIIAVSSLLSFMRKLPSLMTLLSALCSVLSWFVPNGIIRFDAIGLCADVSHSCRAVTMPAAGIIALMILIVNAAFMIMNFIGENK